MTFFRKEVVEFALDQETRRAVHEQLTAIAADPANPLPYYQLALLYRMQWKHEEALGLLLECVRLDASFAPAHVSLAEIYMVRDDMAAARRHAEQAAALGDREALEMLERHNRAEQDS